MEVEAGELLQFTHIMFSVWLCMTSVLLNYVLAVTIIFPRGPLYEAAGGELGTYMEAIPDVV